MSKQLQPLHTSTYQEAKTMLQNNQRCQWRRAAGDCNPSTDPINHLARHEQSRPLYSGWEQDTVACEHTWSEPASWTALCDCKAGEQKVHHILQDCSIWRQHRHQLWPQDESTTSKLWGMAEDLCRTTQFLATGELRVYAWKINCRIWRSEEQAIRWTLGEYFSGLVPHFTDLPNFSQVFIKTEHPLPNKRGLDMSLCWHPK